ncbi:MAG: transglycosylase SLT domain-containing protein [Chitinispirillia bacterium]|jgi:pSer/pThr/pTyr-binding forkhead associated (FHA) protein
MNKEAFLDLGFKLITGKVQTQSLLIKTGEMTIGRHPSNTICFDKTETLVSKRHVILTVLPHSLTVKDCGSTNGTYINGRKIEEAELKVGDIVRFGIDEPQLKLYEVTNTGDNKKEQQSESMEQKTSDGIELPSSESEREIDPNETKTSENQIDSLEKTEDVEPASRSFDLLSTDIPLPLIHNTEEGSSGTGKKPGQKESITTREVGKMMFSAAKNGAGSFTAVKNMDQKELLSKIAKAHFYYRRKRYWIFGICAGILVIISAWFAAGFFKYERIFSSSIALKEQAQKVDRELEQFTLGKEGNTAEKKRLMEELRLKQQRLDSVMSLLPARFHTRFFTDSVELDLFIIMNDFHEPYYSIPSHMLTRVKYYIQMFTQDRKKGTRLLFQRKELYFPYIKKIFYKNHVPEALKYVAMQESMLDPNAKSDAGAVGLWQFMKATALQYGLEVSETNSIDERKDWKKATDAAAKYFHTLLTEFGKGQGVLLAIAAYNAGENKIRRALHAIEDPLLDRDFWYLYRTSSILAEETREYVPKILARMIIDRYPERFGFEE